MQVCVCILNQIDLTSYKHDQVTSQESNLRVPGRLQCPKIDLTSYKLQAPGQEV